MMRDISSRVKACKSDLGIPVSSLKKQRRPSRKYFGSDLEVDLLLAKMEKKVEGRLHRADLLLHKAGLLEIRNPLNKSNQIKAKIRGFIKNEKQKEQQSQLRKQILQSLSPNSGYLDASMNHKPNGEEPPSESQSSEIPGKRHNYALEFIERESSQDLTQEAADTFEYGLTTDRSGSNMVMPTISGNSLLKSPKTNELKARPRRRSGAFSQVEFCTPDETVRDLRRFTNSELDDLRGGDTVSNREETRFEYSQSSIDPILVLENRQSYLDN
jgi:hypothetical protein